MIRLLDKWKRAVKNNSNNFVVFYSGNFRSYREIDALSDYYASLLCEDCGSRVGVVLENSDSYVVAVLAAIKRGCTFVPVDSSLPTERIEYILNECNVKTVFTSSWRASSRLDLYYIDVDIGYSIYPECVINYFEGINDVAYILFTSGTTGEPKGIRIACESLLNLVEWFDETYHVIDNPNILQMANLSFDVSIEETFGCILNGGTLFIPNVVERFHYMKLHDFIVQHNINIIQSVPIFLKNLLLGTEYMPSIHVVISGGESLGDTLKDSIIYKGYNLYNHYGPTETTVDCLAGKCEIGKKVTLGKPISNCECFIVDEMLDFVADGKWGELCCVGVNTALGYTDPENDKGKFFLYKSRRAYRTGDFCMRNEEGEFVYGGRIDNQIKIKGKRIELDEINTRIMQIADIYCSVSIVVPDEFGGKIVSFYNAKQEIHREYIDEYLKRYLPMYMIPEDYVYVENYELTRNQKISRNILEKKYFTKKRSIELVRYEVEAEETEFLIREIERIMAFEPGIVLGESRFDSLGMDSISYICLVVGVEEKYGVEIEDEKLTLFDFRNVREMGEYIHQLREKGNC